MKKISVILTTYNSAATLKRILHSIRNQQGNGTLFEIELLVVDDCSSDETKTILEAEKIVFDSTEKNSGGPNRGRNLALSKAGGDYITIADHDDEWHEDRLISLLPVLEKVPVVSSGYTLLRTETGLKTERFRTSTDASGIILYERNTSFRNKLARSLNGQQSYIGSLVFRSELKDILFEEEFGMTDYDWVLKLLHQQETAEICRSLYNRHVGSGNLSLNEKYRINEFEHSLQTIENYAADYPAEVKTARKRIYGSRARYHYLKDEMKKARYYFLRSERNWKTVLYYLTSFAGSSLVKKRVDVFV